MCSWSNQKAGPEARGLGSQRVTFVSREALPCSCLDCTWRPWCSTHLSQAFRHKVFLSKQVAFSEHLSPASPHSLHRADQGKKYASLLHFSTQNILLWFELNTAKANSLPKVLQDRRPSEEDMFEKERSCQLSWWQLF